MDVVQTPTTGAPGDGVENVFVEAGGLRFEVETAGPTDSDRLALFLHGFPELAFSWRHQLPLFAELGYRCWAPNQRGYGNSSRPDGIRSYHIDHLVADVERLIDASGCRSVTLVAHDWGGIVAWAAAIQRVRPLDRLIVLNLPHPLAARANLSWRQRLRSWYVMFFQLPWLPERLLTAGHARAVGQAFTSMAVDKSRFPDSVLDVYRDHASLPGQMTAMINWYRALRYARPVLERLEQAPALDVPTLVVWGERDDALGVELNRGTDRFVRDFTIRYLPDVSHWVQQEAPEAVNEIIGAWLRGEPVPGSATPSSGPKLLGG